MEEKKIDQWHPAFVSALRLDLQKYWDILEFDDEFQLTDLPQRVDCLVIKKVKEAIIDNEIGSFFKRHNLFEYKSPDDAMNIDTFYKAVGYGCMYKTTPVHVNEIPAEEITITMLRDRYPRELFKSLERAGFTLKEVANGIYRIQGQTLFEMQIIVSSQLEEQEHLYLKALTNHIQFDTFSKYVEQFGKLDGKVRELADIVLNIIVNENQETVKKWKEMETMCQAMRTIMQEELEEERQAGQKEGFESAIFDLVQDGDYSAERGAEKLGITLEEFNERRKKAGYKVNCEK